MFSLGSIAFFCEISIKKIRTVGIGYRRYPSTGTSNGTGSTPIPAPTPPTLATLWGTGSPGPGVHVIVLIPAMAECSQWCSMCTDNKKELAICSCAVCEENLCAKHQDDHAGRKKTSSHVVSYFQFDEVLTQTFPPCSVPVKCGEHGNDIEGFCDKCNIVLCGSCVFGAHHGHNYRSIAQVIAEKRAEITKINGTLVVYQGALTASIKHIDKCEADNTVSTVVAIEAVKASFILVRAKTDVDEAQMILDVTTLSKKKYKMQLGGQKLNVEFIQCEVDTLQNAVTTALASDDDAAFLQLSSGLAPRFAALEQDRSSWVLQPCTNGIVCFAPAAISMGEMGHVLDGDCDIAAAFKVEIHGDARDRVVSIVAVEETSTIDVPLDMFVVNHVSPSGVSNLLPVTNAAVGKRSATLSLVDDGDHVVNVYFGNTHVNCSPIRLAYVDVKAFVLNIPDNGGKRSISIIAKNAQGYGATGVPFLVQLTSPKGSVKDVVLRDSGDGHYNAECEVTCDGVHTVTAMLRNQSLSGSPFRFHSTLVIYLYPYTTAAMFSKFVK
jgi:B-box zinc finger